ncbi:MAG: hypothetical protein M1827_003081 [Pycnora praestabilis]|nr:MAG: hypothetical protein M1827_003081 [Pycnora praestabilis]
MARFPDKPTPDESTALQSFMYLFARLYPCGECAEHFRSILEQFPPQVSSRSSAAAWGCHVHNEVNKSLEKALFDCSKIGDFYDCGCAEDGPEESSKVSCISEAQKYQGALYRPDKEKKSKAQPKPVTIESSALVPRNAYVEDAPDQDSGIVAVVDVPPQAPSPPPAALPAQQRAALPEVNVFDFLVTEETPNASRTMLVPKEQMKMVEHAPAIFEANRQLAEIPDGNDPRVQYVPSTYNQGYEENGYAYGTEPVLASREEERQAFMTPAPRREKERSKHKDKDTTSRSKSDRKRKRQHVEDLDLSAARSRTVENDAVMTDAPPVLHSGLTGGLNRLLSRSEFPPSPDYSGADAADASPLSPLKRSKHTKSNEKPSSRNRITSLISTRKSSSSTQHSDDIATNSRPHKHHRHHRHHHRHSTSPRPTSRKLKAIEYPSSGPTNGTTAPTSSTQDNQLVIFRSRAELFTSFINKGPESEKGCSMNKVLKRFHREREDRGGGLGRGEEEKELWRSLRLRRNERGEVVVFF